MRRSKQERGLISELAEAMPNGFSVFRARPCLPRTRTRPLWARNQESLVLHAAGKHAVRRIKIAEMYWLRSWSAGRIARTLGLTENAVQQIVQKLLRAGRSSEMDNASKPGKFIEHERGKQ